MVLHELGTNAVKYGALSNQTGHVHLDWSYQTSDQHRLLLTWRESGGPPVTPPTRKGFGSVLIGQALAGQGSKAHIEYARDGLVCTVELSIQTKEI
jgi:two-component sensor histidine kinase